MSSWPSSIDSLRRYLGLASPGNSEVNEKLQDIKRRRTIRRLWIGLGVATFVVVLQWSFTTVEFSLIELYAQLPEFAEALTEYFPLTTYFGFFPFVDVMQYWEFIVEADLFAASQVTVAIAIAGTALGVPGALFFGVMASERVIPYPFNFLFRLTMSIIRAIPALVWVLILIPLGGVGPFTATLAVMIDTTGYLGRLFTDELEEIADGPIEGIRSTGASKSQIVSFGMLSQVFRQFIAWLAFDLEHNVRVAISLGLIGAGGLGLELNVQRRTYNYTEMMACIILVILLAGTVELLSQRLRSYLREDEEIERTGILEAFVTAPKKIIDSTMGQR